MGKQRNKAVEVAWRLTDLSPRKKTSCPHCSSSVIGSELAPMSNLPDLWAYSLNEPLVPRYGKGQYVEKTDVQTQVTLPLHAGCTPDRLLLTKAAATVHPLRDLFNTCVQLHNASPLGGVKTHVWGAGNAASSKIIAIGEGPGRVENENGIPFSGPAGQCLSGALYSAGIVRERDILLINTVRHAPDPAPGKSWGIGKPRTVDMLAERPRVLEVIRLMIEQRNVPVRAIVCLGKYAWLQLMEKDQLTAAVKAGKEIDVNAFKISRHLGWHPEGFEYDVPVLLAYHPSYILRRWKNSSNPNTEPCIQAYLDTFQQLKGRLNG